MLKRFVLGSFIVFGLAGCKSVYEQMSSQEGERPTNWKFDYSSGACFGKCPIFSASVDNKGNLSFLGQGFTRFEGDTLLSGNESFRDSLIVRLEAMKFMELDSFYGDPYVQDIPQYDFSLQVESEPTKTVRAKMEIPAALQEFREWFNKELSAKGLL